WNVPFYFLLAVICGCCSYYYSKAFLATEHLVRSIRKPWYRVLAGGMALYVLILFFPPLFGEGYNSITMLSELQAEDVFSKSAFSIDHWNKPLLYVLLALVLLLKPVATAFTVGSGGNG